MKGIPSPWRNSEIHEAANRGRAAKILELIRADASCVNAKGSQQVSMGRRRPLDAVGAGGNDGGEAGQ